MFKVIQKIYSERKYLFCLINEDKHIGHLFLLVGTKIKKKMIWSVRGILLFKTLIEIFIKDLLLYKSIK